MLVAARAGSVSSVEVLSSTIISVFGAGDAVMRLSERLSAMRREEPRRTDMSLVWVEGRFGLLFG